MTDFPAPALLADLQQADAPNADRLVREALALLLQAQTGEGAPAWTGDAWREAAAQLAAPETPGWTALLDALQRELMAQPQRPSAGQPGRCLPAGWELAALLRPEAFGWDEEQELDWAIRYWEAARRAGLGWDADFGEAWRQIEWAAVARQLALLGRARAESREPPPRVLAQVVKTATRYRELRPLLPICEALRPGITQQAYG